MVRVCAVFSFFVLKIWNEKRNSNRFSFFVLKISDEKRNNNRFSFFVLRFSKNDKWKTISVFSFFVFRFSFSTVCRFQFPKRKTKNDFINRFSFFISKTKNYKRLHKPFFVSPRIRADGIALNSSSEDPRRNKKRFMKSFLVFSFGNEKRKTVYEIVFRFSFWKLKT